MSTPTTTGKGAATRPDPRPGSGAPVIGSAKPATARPATGSPAASAQTGSAASAPAAAKTAPTPAAAPTAAATAQPAPAAPKQPLNTPATPPVAQEPRRVKLTLSRLDPFSVFKISFIISVALGLASIVVVAVLWIMLNAMGVFEQLGNSINDIQNSGTSSVSGGNKQSIADMLSFGRVMSLSVVFAVLNAVLLTAMATVSTFIYNVCAAMVGGLRTTLTDD